MSKPDPSVVILGGGPGGYEAALVAAQLGARVTVLHEGAVLAEGSVDHVQNHSRVIEVYLGR